MNEQIVNIYQFYGLQQPAGGAGNLICYGMRTSDKVSAHRRRPGVLILPGGGYGHTSPREAEPVALRFLVRGYVPFVLHYSVAPCRYPVALREAALAMRFIREHAAEFEVDISMVAAIGFSAGAHLCGCLGTLFDSAEVADLGTPELLKPDALGLCYPVAVSWGATHEGSFRNLCGGDEKLRARLSLDALVRPDMAPVFLWHTRDDEAVPVRNSLILARALEEKGIDFAMHIYRHGKHGLSTADEQVYPVSAVPGHSWGTENWPEEMMNFFAEIGFQITDFQEETL